MAQDKFDLYIRPLTPEEVGSGGSGFYFTTGFAHTIAVKGFPKLLCQWMRIFMTPKGSDPIEPTLGTEFSKLIGSNVGVIEDLRDVVMLAVQDCNTQLSYMQRGRVQAADETLLSASLVGFDTNGRDGFDAYVTLKNLKGNEATVALPPVVTR